MPQRSDDDVPGVLGALGHLAGVSLNAAMVAVEFLFEFIFLVIGAIFVGLFGSCS
jgi:hypothetical protein